MTTKWYIGNLEHFHSDWNGQTSDEPYNRTPTLLEITKARMHAGKTTTEDGLQIFTQDVEDRVLVEVRALVGNSLASNRYRDLYRITV